MHTCTASEAITRATWVADVVIASRIVGTIGQRMTHIASLTSISVQTDMHGDCNLYITQLLILNHSYVFLMERTPLQ